MQRWWTAHQECRDEGDDTTVRVHAVGDRAHAVLTHAEADVRALVATKASTLRLEVSHGLRPGQVTASEIGRAAHELGQDWRDRGEYDLGKLTRGLSSIRGLVDGQRLLPAVRKLARNAARELSVFFGVLLAI